MQLLPSALRIDAGMILIDYVSSRDDTTTIAPENFLYTDNGGNLLSAPLTAIVNSSNQTLSLSGNELSISSGNSITLPSTTAMSISGATDTIITSLTTGAILYYDGDKWRNLPVGTISQKLIVGDN
ncbi:MAG: hypothetical protein H6766_07305 [Candidatus Peribacteria bacterium]|nr:MAG: hypothetical protein H6766_07305 [Candidatus Peribacteria bacterium]